MSGLQKPENGKFSDPSICTAKTFFGTAFFVTVRLFCKTRRESVCDKEIETENSTKRCCVLAQMAFEKCCYKALKLQIEFSKTRSCAHNLPL